MDKSQDMTNQSLLEFPCRFPIKVMGRARDDLAAEILALVREHAPDLADGDVRTRKSGKGNYLAITLEVNATSREQLDAIYLALNAHEGVVMTL